LKIMDLFDENTSELKITEISALMSLHKSTVHSLLKTLQLHGYISQNEETGKYKLGLKHLEKGQQLLRSMDIRAVARRYLETLSEQTGQTTHLVILDGKEGVYIDKVEGEKAAIRYSRIGRRVPLHSSAVGKVLLAYKKAEEIEMILHNYHFTLSTATTINNKDQLIEELERVRASGYAIDDQENEPGVRCAATAIRDHAGQVTAAMSISTMTSAVDDDLLQRYIHLLQEKSRIISEQIGFRDMVSMPREFVQ